MNDNVNRRDFTKLTVAAMGGMVAGSLVGCGNGKSESEQPGGPHPALAAFGDVHVCKGLNSCEGKGKGGKNKCAGQSECATTPNAPHACGGKNACKNQGGCGDTVASNPTKDKTGCAVPLSKDSWENAYKKFEAAMKEAGMGDKLPKEKPTPPEKDGHALTE